MKMSKDNLGERMKGYESAFKASLPERLPVIIRIDGCAFHTYTKGMERPYDWKLRQAFLETCMFLSREISGIRMIYLQSDEISLLLNNYEKMTTQSWFDNSVSKMISVSASKTTAIFNEVIKKYYPEKMGLNADGSRPAEGEEREPEFAFFDSRVFVLPPSEVNNYFIWRQQDAMRNSVSSAAQANFSQSELQGVKQPGLLKMLSEQRGIDWEEYETWQKRGACIVREPRPLVEGQKQKYSYRMDLDIPVFTEDRSYVERFL